MKAELRAQARTSLRAIPAAERVRAGAEIARRVWTVPEIRDARHLLVYAALPLEVPTDAIAREARRRGMVLVYPRCLPLTRELALHRVEDDAVLRRGEYGIREPDPTCPIVELTEIDAALVPGLAWDRRGRRLGRGAGYYDRLLGAPGWRGFTCGLFFAAQEAPAVPAEAWDAPLDAVATEREVWRREQGTGNPPLRSSTTQGNREQ